MTERSRIEFFFEDNIANGINIQTSAPIPLGEIWQIQRVIFADMSLNDTKSGVYKVDFGVDGDRAIIGAAYLTGDTQVLDYSLALVGDGLKVFRFIRESQSSPAKRMMILMTGFKRIGDI